MDDEASIRELHAEHGEFLLRHALQLTAGDRQRADDLVHESIERVWRHAAARTGKPPTRAWLLTVARKLAADDGWALERGPGGNEARPNVGDATLLLDVWAVIDALTALPRHDRRIIIEMFYRGRSTAKAAVILGIPGGAVKGRTFLALKALKLALQDRGLAPDAPDRRRSSESRCGEPRA